MLTYLNAQCESLDSQCAALDSSFSQRLASFLQRVVSPEHPYLPAYERGESEREQSPWQSKIIKSKKERELTFLFIFFCSRERRVVRHVAFVFSRQERRHHHRHRPPFLYIFSKVIICRRRGKNWMRTILFAIPSLDLRKTKIF